MTATEAAGWAEYFALLDDVRQFAVWRHEEDGELLDSGRRRPPRFVAVVDDSARWEQFERRASGLVVPARYPVQMFAERWGWARLQVNASSASRRLVAGEEVGLGEVKKADEGRAAEVVAALVGAGHRASIKNAPEGGGQYLALTPADGSLSARWSSGRAFRLYAWGEDGQPLHQKIQCGAVVVRACGSVEDDSGRRRKPRADRLKQLTGWGDVNLWWAGVPAVENRDLPYYIPEDNEPPAVPAPETVGLFGGDSVEYLRLVRRPSQEKPNHTNLLDVLEKGGRIMGSGLSWSLLNNREETVRAVDWRTVSALRRWGCLVTA